MKKLICRVVFIATLLSLLFCYSVFAVEGTILVGTIYSEGITDGDTTTGMKIYYEISLTAGETYTIYLAYEDQNAERVVWSVDDPSILEIVESGDTYVTVKALKEGDTDINAQRQVRADYHGTTYENVGISFIPVSVGYIALQSMTFNMEPVVLRKGEEHALKLISYSPEKAYVGSYTFSSLDKTIATVDENGVVKGIKAGETTLHIKTEKNFHKYIDVMVLVDATGIELNNHSKYMTVGDTLSLKATVSPYDATNINVIWTSSDTSVATVENGTVTAIGSGNAVITATTEDGGFKDTCEISVRQYAFEYSSGRISGCTFVDGFDGKLVIPAEIEGNKIDTVALTGYLDNVTDIVFEEGIKDNATSFKDLTNLKSVKLPDTLTVLSHDSRNGVFENCIGLTEIEIPGSLETVPEKAFQGCTSLKKVVLNEGIKTVGNSAFFGCTALETVVFSEGLETIGMGAFGGCPIKNLLLPDSIKKIWQGGLSDVKDTTVTLPEGMEYCASPFYLSDAEYINFPATADVRVNMSSLAGSKVKAYCVPDTNPYVTTDENGALYNKSMTTLMAYPVGKQENVITVPEGVEKIGMYAFGRTDYCVAEEIHIPSSVVEFDVDSLDECTNLKKIVYDGTEEEFNQIEMWSSTKEFVDTLEIVYNSTSEPETPTEPEEPVEPETPTEPETPVVPDENVTTISVGNVKGKAGETVTVPLYVENNTGILGMMLTISYDESLTLTGLTQSTGEDDSALGSLDFTPGKDLTANPINVGWDGLDADSTNGKILNMTFTIPQDAEDGDVYDIKFTYAPGDVYDNDFNDIDLAIVNGSITVKNYTLGDVNDDGTINMKDVTLLRRGVIGGYGVTLSESADVNCDGVTNMKDVTLLRRYVIGGYGVTLG